MPAAHVLRNNFTAGELSPRMRARSDHPRYQAGVATCENWLILRTGGVTRRPGLHHLALTKYADRTAVLLPFQASLTAAYGIEAGHEYFRFFKDMVQLTSGGNPVEIATPYQEADLPLLRTAQANDVLILVHGSYAPRRLTRLSDTSWSLRLIRFDPMPSYEAGLAPNTTLTPAATTGSDIVFTAGAAVFLETDLDRQIQSGEGRGVVVEVTDSSHLKVDILDDFASTNPIAAGSWTLLGSPAAELKPNKTGPPGARITLDLQAAPDDEPELIQNGAFGAAVGWDDVSQPLIVTGTHTAGDSATLIDTTTDFAAEGVLTSHIVLNMTDGSQGVVDSLATTTNPNDTIVLASPLSGGATNDFTLNDVYEIRQTGSAVISGGELKLSGGTAGVGGRQQDFATVSGRRYRLTWRGRTNPAAMQIGTSSEGSDVLAEALYPVTDSNNPRNEVIFTAGGGTTYLQFRSNQPAVSVVDDVSVRLYSADGWRAEDVGKLVYLNGGLVTLTTVVDATKARGTIVIALTTDDAAAPGAWTLESPAWSDALGWPEHVILQEGRLVLRGTRTFPQHQWHSELDGLFNFARGLLPDDAVVLSMTQAGGNITLNQTAWMLPGDKIFLSTSDAEYAVGGTNDELVSPTQLPKIHQYSTIGSAPIAPVTTNKTIVFVARNGAQVWEVQFNFQNERFDARELSIVAEHLLSDTATLVHLVYAQAPTPVIFGVRSDGVLLALTYDVTEGVTGWSRWTTDGAVEWLLALPHPTRNATQVYALTRRTVEGATVRALEYFAAYTPLHTPTDQQGCTLDAASAQTFAVPTDTVTGLTHLEGETVVAVGDGAYFPDLTVSGGSVTLPQTVSVVQVGRPFTATLVTLPPEIPQVGTIQHLRKHWVELSLELLDTLGLAVQGRRLPFLLHGMTAGQGLPVLTGRQDVLDLGWDQEALITITADLPFPATVLGLSGRLAVGD